KATENDLQSNATRALAGFRKLEEGDYLPELSASLELIDGRNRQPWGFAASDLLYSRRYRVTLVHGEDRDRIEILTRYDDAVPGDPDRRSVRLMRVVWPDFCAALATRVYEQLD